MNTEPICDFCNLETSVKVLTNSSLPLAYCQKCLDVGNIKTRHDVHMNWIINGDKYLENEYIVFFKGSYLGLKTYINNLWDEDVDDFYAPNHIIRTLLIKKLNEKKKKVE